MTTLLTIAKAVTIFEFTTGKPIKPGLKTEDAIFEIKQVDDRVKQFTSTADAVSEAANLKNDANVVSATAKGRLRILISALDPSFIEKYRAQIQGFTTYENLKEFLGNIFATTLSAKEKVSNARTRLLNATRFAKENESFKVFLARIKLIAAPITVNTDQKVTDLLVEDAFRSNLSPTLKQFLIDHGQNDASLDHIATFLDDKKKHVFKVETNQVQVEEIAELRSQIAILTDLVKTALVPQNDTNVDNAANIYQVATTGSRKKTFVRREDWEYKENGKPIRCGQCGLFGHAKSKCPRTCTLVCHHCKKVGHLKAVCRAFKNLAKNGQGVQL